MKDKGCKIIDLIFTDGLKSGKVDRLSYRWVDMSTGSQVNRSTVDRSTGRRVETSTDLQIDG